MSSHPHSITDGRGATGYSATGRNIIGAAPPWATAPVLPGSSTARDDVRWPHIVSVLASLRLRRRFAVRIVDADCGCGTVLIAAVRYARSLGFTAIEGRGIDGSPTMIGRARAAASPLRDHAIGLEFDLADMTRALAQEADFPADIVLWHGSRVEDARSDVAAALAAAAVFVIGDVGPAASCRVAA